VEATEPTEALRKPPKVTESRFDFWGVGAEDTVAVTWRGTRDDGDPRMDCRCVTVFDIDLSPFSRTPNSLMEVSPGVGDGSVEPGARLATLRLARRSIMPEFFGVGEPTADIRLEMRGILVGVYQGELS
jgi:hypothetical protein